MGRSTGSNVPRHRLSDTKTERRRVSMWVAESEWEVIEAEAKKAGIGTSSFVRQAARALCALPTDERRKLRSDLGFAMLGETSSQYQLRVVEREDSE